MNYDLAKPAPMTEAELNRIGCSKPLPEPPLDLASDEPLKPCPIPGNGESCESCT